MQAEKLSLYEPGQVTLPKSWREYISCRSADTARFFRYICFSLLLCDVLYCRSPTVFEGAGVLKSFCGHCSLWQGICQDKNSRPWSSSQYQECLWDSADWGLKLWNQCFKGKSRTITELGETFFCRCKSLYRFPRSVSINSWINPDYRRYQYGWLVIWQRIQSFYLTSARTTAGHNFDCDKTGTSSKMTTNARFIDEGRIGVDSNTFPYSQYDTSCPYCYCNYLIQEFRARRKPDQDKYPDPL